MSLPVFLRSGEKDIHVFVWDELRGLLWALGNDELRAYRVVDGPGGGCELQMDFQTNLPDTSGHDLVRVSEPRRGKSLAQSALN